MCSETLAAALAFRDVVRVASGFGMPVFVPEHKALHREHGGPYLGSIIYPPCSRCKLARRQIVFVDRSCGGVCSGCLESMRLRLVVEALSMVSV